MVDVAAGQWESAIEFLLRSEEPAVRVLTRRDLLGEEADEDAAAILSGPMVSALLAGQQSETFRPGRGWRALPGARFGFGVNAYRNWTGAHWRLVSLVELGVPAGEPRCLAAAERCSGGGPGRSASMPFR